MLSMLIGAYNKDFDKIFIIAAAFNLNKSFGFFERKPVRQMSYALCRELGKKVLLND